MSDTENLTLGEATTQQILDELFNRRTFAGVIVHSPTSHKFSGQQHNGFELRTTCDYGSTLALLESAIVSVQQNAQEEDNGV